MATILCVSEQSGEVDEVAPFLRMDGHEVVTAPDALHAVELMLGRSFGAALLFLGTTSRQVWDLVPLLDRLDRGIPILTVSLEDSVETQREIRRSRVFYHLTQPIDMLELREALEGALARREERR